MALKTDEIKVRVAPEVKAGAQAVLDHWNMSMSQAVGLFLIKVADTGGIPFDLTVDPAARAAQWASAHTWSDDAERREHEHVYRRLAKPASPALSGNELAAAAMALIEDADE